MSSSKQPLRSGSETGNRRIRWRCFNVSDSHRGEYEDCLTACALVGASIYKDPAAYISRAKEQPAREEMAVRGGQGLKLLACEWENAGETGEDRSEEKTVYL